MAKTIITAGIDIGSTASKVVILADQKMISQYIGPSTVNPSKMSRLVYQEALNAAGISMDMVDYIVGTGYGRGKVDFANENVSEISCHAKGAHLLLPTTRTIIDMGGQDTKVISIDKHGLIIEFAMNDKCAAGTGRFLDFMARSMGLEIKDMVRLHFEEGTPSVISNMCSVFAESEVINLINEEVPLPCIVKGLHLSIANKVSTLARRAGLTKDVVITGGVAKNRGVVDSLENILKFKALVFPEEIDPQLIGAVGAAALAFERVLKK